MVDGASATDAPHRPPRFVDLLRLRPFAVLYSAETQSIIGDQLARVALSVLVFTRTGNAAATAATYATTLLPAIFGGLFLAGIGDRLPRRAVMVGTDAARCLLVGAMALPGMPLWAIIALLVVAVLLGPVFSASEVSYLSASLTGEQFRSATGIRMVTGQAAQVGGFLLGGLAVALVHVRGALAIDAATFAASVLLVGFGLAGKRQRSDVATAEVASASAEVSAEVSAEAEVVEAAMEESAVPAVPAAGQADDPAREASTIRSLWNNRWLRQLVLLSVLAGFFVVPEGLAVPIGAHLHVSTDVVGILLASMPLGGAVGASLLIRLVPAGARIRVAYWMAVACGLPLIVTVVQPPWPVLAGCWAVSGALSAYQVEVISMMVHAIPDDVRSRVVGGLSATLLGAQGVGLLVFGGVGEATFPGLGVAMAGIVGFVLALMIGQPRRQSARHRQVARVAA